MTVAGVLDADAKVLAFLGARYQWLRPPRVIEDPYDKDTTVYHMTDAPDGYYDLLIPRWWDEHRRDLLIHECGHLLAYFCGRTRDVIREWLIAMGGDVALNDHRLRGEMFAEHFARAEDPEYRGQNYPALVWLVPFDAVKMRAFCEGLAPATAPQPSPPPIPGGSMKVIDIRAQLPLVSQNIPNPSHATKSSNTVHWTGGSDTIVTDEQAIAAIIRWHGEHIRKDWSSDIPDVQSGAGLMYAEVIAPSGTVLITRDPDAILWHSSSTIGNRDSRPILVICDGDDLPTNQQLASLDSRITFPEFQPHKFWVGTQCPGPELVAFINERRVDDMFTQVDREKLNRLHEIIEAEEPKTWIQRHQDWLSRAIKSVWPNADTKGPDVTTGQPRT